MVWRASGHFHTPMGLHARLWGPPLLRDPIQLSLEPQGTSYHVCHEEACKRSWQWRGYVPARRLTHSAPLFALEKTKGYPVAAAEIREWQAGPASIIMLLTTSTTAPMLLHWRITRPLLCTHTHTVGLHALNMQVIQRRWPERHHQLLQTKGLCFLLKTLVIHYTIHILVWMFTILISRWDALIACFISRADYSELHLLIPILIVWISPK